MLKRCGYGAAARAIAPNLRNPCAEPSSWSPAALAFGALPASAGLNRELASPPGPPSSGCSEPGSGTAWGSRAASAWSCQAGWGPSKILKHFYSGMRTARARRRRTCGSGLSRAGGAVDQAEAEAGAVEIRVFGDPTTGPKIATILPVRRGVRAAGNEYLIMDGTGATVDSVEVDRPTRSSSSTSRSTRGFGSRRRHMRTTVGPSSSICTRATAAGV